MIRPSRHSISGGDERGSREENPQAQPFSNFNFMYYSLHLFHRPIPTELKPKRRIYDAVRQRPGETGGFGKLRVT
ncbi:hypothetical protein MC885_009036 [Smutsia gigantea]|nr:hypothetical protein MC885_009036 [Smutsia gigantea]